MTKAKRKEYQKKLTGQLFEHQEFLSRRLKIEWEQLEKSARREKIVRQAKEAGQTAIAVTVKTILALLVVGGTLAIGAAAPNVFGAVGRLRKDSHFFNKKDFNEAKKYLKRQNYITVKGNSEALEMEITKKGMEKILQTAFSNLKINVQEKWDGIWRIVIFDIPDRHKWAREGFRERMKEMGLYQMQESVFVAPYPCEEEIKFLVSLFSISGYVRLIETSLLIPDSDMKEYFHIHH